MFTRQLVDVEKSDFFVDWGNGTSHRLLTQKDGMGFTVCHTVVRAGSESRLHYRRHLEACYCVAGSGEVEDMSGEVHRIEPGTIYVLNEHDDHYLRADAAGDMILVSVFNPPLDGTERHVLSENGGSAYWAGGVIVPSIGGWARMTGLNTIFIDDRDPFAHGFVVK